MFSCQNRGYRIGEVYSIIYYGAGYQACPGVNKTYAGPQNSEEFEVNYKTQMIPCSQWIMTIIFMALSVICTAILIFHLVLRLLFNKASTYGLYVWNTLADIFCVVAIFVWSALFRNSISKNIAVTDSLRMEDNFSSNGLAKLGFSFWILLVPIVCYIINYGLIFYRNHLIQRESRIRVMNTNRKLFN